MIDFEQTCTDVLIRVMKKAIDPSALPRPMPSSNPLSSLSSGAAATGAAAVRALPALAGLPTRTGYQKGNESLDPNFVGPHQTGFVSGYRPQTNSNLLKPTGPSGTGAAMQQGLIGK